MQVFTSEQLQRHPAEVQQSALSEPTIITYRGRPRLVMLSIDEFDRMRGRRHTVLQAARFSDDLLAEMREIAGSCPSEDSEPDLIGGLLDETAGPAESRAS